MKICALLLLAVSAPALAQQATVVQQVMKTTPATILTLTTSGNPSLLNRKVTFTATVKTSTGHAVTKGHVAFSVNNQPFATATMNSYGHAICSETPIVTGNLMITATYEAN